MSKSEDSLRALIAFLDANGVNHDKADEVLKSIQNAPSLDVLQRCNELGRKVEASKNVYSEFMPAAEEFLRFYEQHADELKQREDYYLRLKKAYDFNVEQARLVAEVNRAMREDGYLE